MPTLKLRSSDNVVFEVDEDVAKLSLVIKTLVEEVGINAEVIPLANVSAPILQKIIEWGTFHKNDPEPTDNDMNELSDEDEYFLEVYGSPRRDQHTPYIMPWDLQFFSVDQATLAALVEAADYLQIQRMYETACQAFANSLKRKTIPEMQYILRTNNESNSE